MKTQQFAFAVTAIWAASVALAQAQPSGNNFGRGPSTSSYYVGLTSETPRGEAGAVSVISFKSSDQNVINETAKDLRIMCLLLSENLGKAFPADAPDYKLGVPLLLRTQGHAAQGTYIDGFGVIFNLRVRFPLIAPTAEEKHPEPAQQNTPWEKARRALEGTPESGSSMSPYFQAQEAQPFQTSLVVTLKSQIIETLRNASNFRHVAPNEWVAVTIIGPPNNPPTAIGSAVVGGDPFGSGSVGVAVENQTPVPGGASSGNAASNGGTGEAVVVGSDRETIMTIRIKKADADAFASGNMTPEAFLKTAEETRYFGSAVSATEAAEYLIRP